MKKTFLLPVLALLLGMGLPLPAQDGPRGAAEPVPVLTAGRTEAAPEPAPALSLCPQTLLLRDGDRLLELSTEDYLCGVLAAEMPASFPEEALKAQAVAARSYLLSRASSGRHPDAAICADPGCCQAWLGEEALRERWGADYDANAAKIRAAVEATAGELLCYEGQPILAAFHSSSDAATEDSAAVWGAQPYLVSVSSPETEADVPGYRSELRCWPTDLRDTLLSLRPEADFSGPIGGWIGEILRDESGRVAEAELGGVFFSGPELRQLFSLRSTAFTLSLEDGIFVFSVTGHGHGVGMSQYGAKVLAERGADYREILAHYYPGTELVLSA